jgi:hypothetical protein
MKRYTQADFENALVQVFQMGSNVKLDEDDRLEQYAGVMYPCIEQAYNEIDRLEQVNCNLRISLSELVGEILFLDSLSDGTTEKLQKAVKILLDTAAMKGK